MRRFCAPPCFQFFFFFYYYYFFFHFQPCCGQNSSSTGGWHFLQKGGLKFTKSWRRKTCDPLISATKILWPPHRYTLPPKQAKISLKSAFLNKIKKLSVVILWLPTFWLSKILWPPPIFLSKNLWPQYIWDPPSEENASPLRPKFLFPRPPFFKENLLPRPYTRGTLHFETRVVHINQKKKKKSSGPLPRAFNMSWHRKEYCKMIPLGVLRWAYLRQCKSYTPHLYVFGVWRIALLQESRIRACNLSGRARNSTQ